MRKIESRGDERLDADSGYQGTGFVLENPSMALGHAHIFLFGEDSLAGLGASEGSLYQCKPFSLHFRYCGLCVQLFHPDRSMVSDHPEIRNRAFFLRDSGKLVYLATGKVPTGESLARAWPFLLLRIQGKVKKDDHDCPLFGNSDAHCERGSHLFCCPVVFEGNKVRSGKRPVVDIRSFRTCSPLPSSLGSSQVVQLDSSPI